MSMRAVVMLLTLAALTLGVAGAARAQGFFVTPSLSVAEEFDDNVFVSAVDPQWDFITRFTPGVLLGYRSVPFTLLLSSSVDSEIFARNTELSDVANRKRAALEVKYLPYRLLTLGLDVTYFETNTPAELVPTTGLQLARTRATQLRAAPAASYDITARDTVRGSYEFIRDTLDGGFDNDTHRVKLGYSRQITPLDTGMLNYRLNVFQTDAPGPTTITNTPTLGWIRQLTPLTTLTLEGGPRFVNDGSVEPEAHGRIDHTFKIAKVALDYQRTESVVVGRPGKFELENFTGSVEVVPLKDLTLRFEPGYFRTFGNVDPTATVYGFLLSAFYPIKTWMTARLNYRFAYQDQGGVTVGHNIVTLSLDFAHPLRLNQ